MSIDCLLVDDDAEIAQLVVDYLARFGMQCVAVRDGPAMRNALLREQFDLVLLDLMLPGEDGLALCRALRRDQPALPVIMLTAQGDPLSRVLGLEMGADDYLPKPFEPRELVARIKAVLRRGTVVAARPLAGKARFGLWTFDRLRHELLDRDGTVLALSSAEYRLLSAFVEHPGRVPSRERLLELTRAPGVAVSDRSIDLAVSRLRGKL